MVTITRRKFTILLGMSLVSLTLLDEVAGQPTVLQPERGDDPLFWLRTLNGSDILFYGVNLKRYGEVLRPDQIGKPSYLIAQVPAQSLHEYAFYDATLTPKGQQRALVSGPSFLVFELWPTLVDNSQGTQSTYRNQQTLRCTLAEALAWDDMTRFRLVAANEAALSHLWPCYSSLNEVKSVNTRNPSEAYRFYDFKYYSALLQGIFWHKRPLEVSQSLVTLIEAPAGMLLSPFLRKPPSAGPNLAFQAYFLANGRLPVQQFYITKPDPITHKTLRFVRIVQEIWQTEQRHGIASQPWKLQPTDPYENQRLKPAQPKPQPKPDTAQRPALPPASIPAPVLPPDGFGLGMRLLGYLDGPEGAASADGDGCGCPPATPSTTHQFLLPGTADKRQLLALNQLGLIVCTATAPYAPTLEKNFRSENYDIKVPSALVLGGRGGSFKLHYKNLNNLPADLSLVEYEHHIQDGRDNFIQVAHIGVIAPYSLKAIHVRQARRIFRDGQSYLEYKEYLELLETSKDFELVTKPMLVQSKGIGATEYEFFATPNPQSGQPPIDKPFYPAQLHFSRVEAAFTRTPNMEPMGESADCQCFWPRKEGTKEDKDENLLKLPFRKYDADGNLIETVSEHSIQFFRRDFFGPCEKSAKNPAGLNTNVSSVLQPGGRRYLGKQDDGRLRLPLNGKRLALTKTAPAAAGSPLPTNKPNYMVADWAEYYYHIAKSKPGGPNVFDTATHLIRAQIRHVKAYIDHAQGVATQKLASLLEYDLNYLNSLYDSTGNPLRLMLRHTDAFLSQQLLSLDGTVLADTNALYANLHQGMGKIREAFANVGKQLGGLTNPDPVLEYVAGIEQNIALPTRKALAAADSVTEAIKRPLNILNGDAAELMGGIKLVRILREVLADEDTPRFIQNRFEADFTTLATAINDIKNPVIENAVKAVSVAQATVDDLARQVDRLESGLPALSQKVVAAQAALAARLPDFDKINTLLLAQLELSRLRLITDEQDAVKQLDALRLELTHSLEPYVNAYLSVAAVAAATEEMRNASVAAQSIYYLSDALFGEYDTLLKELTDGIITAITPALVAGTQAETELRQFTACTTTLRTYLVQRGRQLQTQLRTITQGGVSNRTTALQSLANDFTGKKDASGNDVSATKEQLACIRYLLRQYDLLRPSYLPSVVVTEEKLRRLDKLVALIRLTLQTELNFYQNQYRQLQTQVNDLLNTSVFLSNTAQDVVNKLVDKEQRDKLAAIAAAVATAKTRAEATHASESEKAAAMATAATATAFTYALGLSEQYRTYTGELRDKIWAEIKKNSAYAALTTTYDDALRAVNENVRRFQDKQAEYQQKAEELAKSYADQLEDAFRQQLTLIDASKLQAALDAYDQVRNLLKTPARQELRYDWTTTGFTEVNLGLVRFMPQHDPPTTLALHSSSTLTLDATHLPAVTTNAVFATDTQVTNFAISFLDVLIIDFGKLSFQGGTGRSPSLDVRIKGVRFAGPLTFIQALQDMLSGLVDAFLQMMQEHKVTIDYQSPVFGVSVPGFTLTNISFGVKAELFFDRKPVLVTLRLALPESKATVAVGIMGGGFYGSLTASTTQGVVGIEVALEMGALLGLSLGPIRGEVRFMVGIYYRKNVDGVLLEGYFIAEGTLKVWIISVSARLYMAVRSYGSYVEGTCEVSYKVKIGFLKKSFSATYVKTIAGAASKRGEAATPAPQALTQAAQYKVLALADTAEVAVNLSAFLMGTGSNKVGTTSEPAIPQTWEDQFQVLSRQEYQEFCAAYY